MRVTKACLRQNIDLMSFWDFFQNCLSLLHVTNEQLLLIFWPYSLKIPCFTAQHPSRAPKIETIQFSHGFFCGVSHCLFELFLSWRRRDRVAHLEIKGRLVFPAPSPWLFWLRKDVQDFILQNTFCFSQYVFSVTPVWVSVSRAECIKSGIWEMKEHTVNVLHIPVFKSPL